MNGDSVKEVLLIYDKECPFCSRYAQLIQLRKNVGNLILINARDEHPIVDKIQERGLDLNEGMVLVVDEQFYHGARAIHMIALLSNQATFFNKINVWLFKSEPISRFLYPAMRAGRNAVLRMLGRSKIQ